jgi:hypothetical protein
MVADNREATEPRVPLGYVEVITSKVLQSPPKDNKRSTKHTHKTTNPTKNRGRTQVLRKG